MFQRIAFLTLAAALTAACASSPPVIRLDARPADVAHLTGEWHGEYSGGATGRNGSILFVLRPGSDSAFGEVLMVPAGYSEPRTAHEAREQMRRPIPRLLAVAFVHVEGGEFSGRMEPYRDPVCGCPLTTVFSGRLTTAEEIRGTFTTTAPMHDTQTGVWQVRRVKR
jgi:hypothetical protein